MLRDLKLPDCMMPDGADPCLAYQELYQMAQKMEQALTDFITEYCDREGDEDYPVPVEQQSDPLVKQAMIALNQK